MRHKQPTNTIYGTTGWKSCPLLDDISDSKFNVSFIRGKAEAVVTPPYYFTLDSVQSEFDVAI